jgi:hypothetical protein
MVQQDLWDKTSGNLNTYIHVKVNVFCVQLVDLVKENKFINNNNNNNNKSNNIFNCKWAVARWQWL